MDLAQFMDLLKAGGSAGLIAVVYVAWQAGRTAGRAVDLLESINKHLADGREEIQQSARRLDQIDQDIKAIPLEMARFVKSRQM